jgi:hypothetical protein
MKHPILVKTRQLTYLSVDGLCNDISVIAAGYDSFCQDGD